MNEAGLLALVNQAIKMKPYGDPRFPPSLYYRFLYLLAANTQPRLSVELGVCGGGGSLHLAWGWPDGRVIGVDVGVEYPDHIAYVKHHYPNFHLWLGDSVEAAERVFQEYGAADILFIDTVHTYAATVAELNAWRPYLSERAIVCFDDLNRKEMGNFWDELPQPKMRLDMLHGGEGAGEGGFGVIW